MEKNNTNELLFMQLVLQNQQLAASFNQEISLFFILRLKFRC